MSGALALSLTACGDDIINVENETTFTTVESIDDLECNKDNDGIVAFESSTKKMYSCADGEWSIISASEAIDYRCKANALKDSTGYEIICDGEKIATITNGTDGKNGKNGTNGGDGKDGEDGKNGTNGKNGKNGTSAKDVNVDSLTTVISDTLTKELVDSLSCQVKDNWTDSSASLVYVTITCGDGEKTIELPTLIPSKNLSNVYKRTVVFKFPASFSEIPGTITSTAGFIPRRVQSSNDIILSENLQRIQLFDFSNYDYETEVPESNLAELTVMELDDKALQTGKNFIFDMATLNTPKKAIVIDTLSRCSIYSGYCDYSSTSDTNYVVEQIVFTGEMKVTNLISPVVQLRVTLNGLKAVAYSSNDAPIALNAIVDLSSEDTIVVNFLTDYKAARVSNLIENGSDFEKATKQANKELASALGLAEDHSMFEVQASNDTMAIHEFYITKMWPIILADLGNEDLYVEYYSYPTVLFDYNQAYTTFRNSFAQNGNLDNAENLTMHEAYSSSSYSTKTVSAYFIDLLAYFHIKTTTNNLDLEFLQKGLKKTYDLPKCDQSRSEKPYFLTTKKDGYFEAFYCDGETELWTPYYYSDLWSRDDFKKSVLSECSEATEDDMDTLITKNDTIIYICQYSQSYETYDWFNYYSGSDDYSECNKENVGKYTSNGVGSGAEHYKCVYNAETNEYADEWVSPVEYQTGVVCNKEAKDTIVKAISQDDGEEYWAQCQENDGEFEWNSLSYKEIAEKALGKCSENNDGIFNKVELHPGYISTVVCENGEWRPTKDFETVAGICNEKAYEKNELVKVDIGKMEKGLLHTMMGYIVCTQDDDEYFWRKATYNEKNVGKPCTSKNSDEVIEKNGEKKVCTEKDWANYDAEHYCNAHHTDLPEGDAKPNCASSTYNADCVFEGEHYAHNKNEDTWDDVKTVCSESYNSCEASSEDNSDDCRYLEYFAQEQTYKCDYKKGEWVQPKDEQEECNRQAESIEVIFPDDLNGKTIFEALKEDPTKFICYAERQEQYRYISTDDGKTYSWVKYVRPEDWCKDKVGECAANNDFYGKNCKYPFDNNNYICAKNVESQDEIAWVEETVATFCNINGEVIDPDADSEMQDMIEFCKYKCSYKNETYVSQSGYTWMTANEYCTKYSTNHEGSSNNPHYYCNYVEYPKTFANYTSTDGKNWTKATDVQEYCNFIYSDETAYDGEMKECHFEGQTYYQAIENATATIGGKSETITKGAWYNKTYSNPTYYCGECKFTGDPDDCFDNNECTTSPSETSTCDANPFNKYDYRCTASADKRCLEEDEGSGDCLKYGDIEVTAYWEEEH